MPNSHSLRLADKPVRTLRRYTFQPLATGSLLFTRAASRAADAAKPANGRLQIALIGVGGRGQAALTALQGEQIVAFCDVDHVRGREQVAANRVASGALARFPDARWFHDYREMFAQMSDQIDAVVVSVPDFMHYAIGMAVLRQRKHLYMEKPLCRCITEVRALRAAAPESRGIRAVIESLGVTTNFWQAKPWSLPDELHPTAWVANRARSVISETAPAQPLFLTASFYAPHPPLFPPKTYFEKYLAAALPAPARGDWVQWDALSPDGDRAGHRIRLEGEKLRAAQAGYFGLIEHLDAQLAPLIAAFTARSRAILGGKKRAIDIVKLWAGQASR